MEDLFRSYWWLLFPLGWFIFGGFNSLLNYRRHSDALDLIKTYAAKGEQPPEALLKVLDQPIDGRRSDYPVSSGSRMNDGNWFSVVLFGVMSVGFAYASYTDMYGAGDAFLIVAFVLGALCLASLVSALLGRRRGS